MGGATPLDMNLEKGWVLPPRGWVGGRVGEWTDMGVEKGLAGRYHLSLLEGRWVGQ